MDFASFSSYKLKVDKSLLSFLIRVMECRDGIVPCCGRHGAAAFNEVYWDLGCTEREGNHLNAQYSLTSKQASALGTSDGRKQTPVGVLDHVSSQERIRSRQKPCCSPSSPHSGLSLRLPWVASVTAEWLPIIYMHILVPTKVQATILMSLESLES